MRLDMLRVTVPDGRAVGGVTREAEEIWLTSRGSSGLWQLAEMSLSPR